MANLYIYHCVEPGCPNASTANEVSYSRSETASIKCEICGSELELVGQF